MQNDIVIKGAREHNLKNIDVTIPRNKLTVISGLSGSGKTRTSKPSYYSRSSSSPRF
jgi:excinuclease ABC subunit A